MPTIDVHGLRVHVTGDWPEPIDNLLLDFAWFERPGELRQGGLGA